MMPQQLPAPDRRKLALILALLASDKPGERNAAGLAADRFIKGRALSWDLVIDPPPEVKVVRVPSPESPPAPRSRRSRSRSQPADDEPAVTEWRKQAKAALEHPQHLTPWEVGFLSGLNRFPKLSEKQTRSLKEIVTKLRGAGCQL